MPDAPLIVYAAGGVAPPLLTCGELFTGLTGIDVRVVSGKPEDLVRDIQDMGVGDLISLGAEYFMDILQQRGLVIRESRVSLGTRTSTILVRDGNPKDITTLEDLGRDDVTVGIASAGCLVGVWEDIAAKAGLTGQIRSRITRFADSCGHLIRELNTRQVDAIIGWESFKHFKPDSFECVPVPDHLAIMRSTALGRLSMCARADDADRFTEFLMGQDGRKVYESLDWSRP